MTPKELKNSILQRVIEGKLVEQKPEEGRSKSALDYFRIRTIKNGKALYDIPEQWEWVNLSNLSNLIGGFAFKSSNYTREGIRVIRISDFNETGLLNKDKKYYKKDESLSNYMIKQMDILMCMTGGTVGKTAYLKSVTEDFYLNQRVAIIRNKNQEILNTDYMYYVITSQFIKNIIDEEKNSTNDNISMKLIKDFPIPLPPLGEQKRIVEKIEELLPLVDEYEKNWEKLEDLNKKFPENMKKSLLQEAIKGKLVEQRHEEGTGEELYKLIQEEKEQLIKEGKIKKQKDLPEITEEEIPFDIPESWKWVRISDISILNPKNKLKDELDVGFVPMTLIEDGYGNNHFFEIRKWIDIKKGYTHFANGDIGVAKITPCFQNRKSVIISNLPNGFGAGTTELSIIRPYEKLVNNKFLLYFFKSHYFIEGGMKSFSGTAGQQRIDKNYIGCCLLPLPPLEEQKRIVEKLDKLLPYNDKLSL